MGSQAWTTSIGRAVDVQRLLPAILAGVCVTWLASVDGGYFPQQWGWPALGLLLVSTVALLVKRDVALGPLEWLTVGALTAYAAWILLSTVWSPSAAQPVLELERTILYVGAMLALLVLGSRRSMVSILAALLVAITAVAAYALSTRLVPDHLGHYPPSEGYQLAAPLGYWNALGVLTTMGVLIAVGLATHVRASGPRMAAALALVVLVPTLYFTFSRGALLALGIGALVMAVVEPRRARLGATALAVVAAPAIAVWLAAHDDALTKQGAPLSDAAHEGHRLALLLLPLASLSVLAIGVLEVAERRVTIGRSARRVLAWILIAIALLGVAAVVARAGNPVDLVRTEVDAFTGPLHANNDLNGRLLEVSGNGRVDYWRVAWSRYEDEPVLGVGAGGFEREWLRYRPTAFYARDAHNLYLETLLELGPVALFLLAITLGTPLVAVWRARARPGVAAAAAVYAAFLSHAAVDWDWEMPAVTLTALFAAGVVLLAARPVGLEPLGRAWRLGLTVALVALVSFTFVGHIGNSYVARSADALARGDGAGAARAARTARRWLPWSYEPWQRLGEAQLASGNLGDASVSFDRAIERDHTNWALWYERALASTGPARRRALATASRLNPRSPELAELRTSSRRD